MKNALTIMRREFRAYFGSPLGYIVSASTSSWLDWCFTGS